MPGNARLFVIGVLIPIFVGCSFEASRIVSPSAQAGADDSVFASSQAAGLSTRYLWGVYEIGLDPSSARADIVPVRTPEGHLNALRFLEVGPCDSCVTVSNAQNVGPKEWMVDVQLRHPFTGLDKFTGFDVRGIVMFDPSFTFPSSGLSVPDGSVSGSGALLNPDGYTTLFNPIDYPPGSTSWPAWEYQHGKLATPVDPSSLLNPFKAYCPDTSRRHFACGAADTKTLHIRFPSAGPMRFGYAVDANWAPASKDPPAVPDDFPPEANMPEAYRMEFEVIANDLWCDASGTGGGDIRFVLKAYDHQNPHPVSEGGDVAEFRWEVPGMSDWLPISPQIWEDGADSYGPFVKYTFVEAPVPDVSGPHRVLFAGVDKTTGLKDLPQTAYILGEFNVATGLPCWSPGVLVSDHPSNDWWAHLSMEKAHWVDSSGVLHLFYLDEQSHIHHVQCLDEPISDDEILPGEPAFEPNALPDDSGGIHLLYTDDPGDHGGNVIYRYIDPSGTPGAPLILSSSAKTNQFETTMAIAPDGTMLALWMESQNFPFRRLCGAWFNGSGWTPEMTLSSGSLPDGWVNPNVVADSSSVFHICFNNGVDMDLYYMQFDHGIASQHELLQGGPNRSAVADMTIDSLDRIYVVFVDNRLGNNQGYLMMRDPVTGLWSDELDFIGHNYESRRFIMRLLPDGRLGIVWTDFRDWYGRSLFAKTFDPFMSEVEIQEIPDEEIDAGFTAEKEQLWLTGDSSGTLYVIWSDLRDPTHFQLYYSKCTP